MPNETKQQTRPSVPLLEDPAYNKPPDEPTPPELCVCGKPVGRNIAAGECPYLLDMRNLSGQP
jgi:hypothetical protein